MDPQDLMDMQMQAVVAALQKAIRLQAQDLAHENDPIDAQIMGLLQRALDGCQACMSADSTEYS
jgi:hypothetical protein